MSGFNSQQNTGSPNKSLDSMLHDFQKEIVADRKARFNRFLEKLENSPSDSAVIDLNTMEVVQKGRLDFSHLSIEKGISEKAQVMLDEIQNKMKESKVNGKRKSAVPKKLACNTATESKSSSLQPSSSQQTRMCAKDFEETDENLFHTASSPHEKDLERKSRSEEIVEYTSGENIDDTDMENAEDTSGENIDDTDAENMEDTYEEYLESTCHSSSSGKNNIHPSMQKNKGSIMHSPIKKPVTVIIKDNLEAKCPNLSNRNKRKSHGPSKSNQNNSSPSLANVSFYHSLSVNSPHHKHKTKEVEEDNTSKFSLSHGTRNDFDTIQDRSVPGYGEFEFASKLLQYDVPLSNKMSKTILNKVKDSYDTASNNEAKNIFNNSLSEISSKRNSIYLSTMENNGSIRSSPIKNPVAAVHMVNLQANTSNLSNTNKRKSNAPSKLRQNNSTRSLANTNFYQDSSVNRSHYKYKTQTNRDVIDNNDASKFSQSKDKYYDTIEDHFISEHKESELAANQDLSTSTKSLTKNRVSKLFEDDVALSNQMSETVLNIAEDSHAAASDNGEKNIFNINYERFESEHKKLECTSSQIMSTPSKLCNKDNMVFPNQMSKSPLKRVKYSSNPTSEQSSKKTKSDSCNNTFVILPKILKCDSKQKSPLKQVKYSRNPTSEQSSKKPKSDSCNNTFVISPKILECSSKQRSPEKQSNPTPEHSSKIPKSDLCNNTFVIQPKISYFCSEQKSPLKQVKKSNNRTSEQFSLVKNASIYSGKNFVTPPNMSERGTNQTALKQVENCRNFTLVKSSKQEREYSINTDFEILQEAQECASNVASVLKSSDKRNKSASNSNPSNPASFNQKCRMETHSHKRNYKTCHINDEMSQKRRKISIPPSISMNDEAEDSFEWLLKN